LSFGAILTVMSHAPVQSIWCVSEHNGCPTTTIDAAVGSD
jgi:hypothetical protein